MRRFALLACLVIFSAIFPESSLGQQWVFHLSHHVEPEHLIQVASEKFAALVEERTKGQVKIIVHPAAQLATLRGAAQGLQVGTIDLGWVDLPTLGEWAPELGFVSLPYLFRSWEHAEKVFFGPLGEQFRKQVREKLGIEILGYGAAGFRVVLSARRPLRNPSDFRGLKIRVPPIWAYVETFKALGANPTPMAWGEVYTALQTGVIEALENPPQSLWAGKMYEVTRYATRTNHIFTDVHLMMSRRKFESLPTPLQQVLRDAAREVIEGWYWPRSKTSEEYYWRRVTQNLRIVGEADVAGFARATRRVIDDFIKRTNTGDLIRQIEAVR
jgi:tripartite ATP-independent transporter DctP family solute receptor